MPFSGRAKPIWAAWIGATGKAFALLSGIAMLLMMSAGALDIVTTNLFSRPIATAFEFTEAMMVVVVFFALALAQARKSHIRVEVIYERMPRIWQRIVDVIQFLLSAIFFGLITFYAWKAAAIGFAQGEYASGIVNFPLWPARVAMAVGGTLMTLQCLVDLAGCLFGWQIDDSADMRLGEANVGDTQ